MGSPGDARSGILGRADSCYADWPQTILILTITLTLILLMITVIMLIIIVLIGRIILCQKCASKGI